jgi:hypothetical protein
MRLKAKLEIIGINPYISLPVKVLECIFRQSGRNKGPIPVCGEINSVQYKQSLVRYSGKWRLYVNTTMLRNSPKRIGEKLDVTIAFDPSDRSIKPHPGLLRALDDNPGAKIRFASLTASRRKEIIRYISSLKSEESVMRNIARAVDFLSGRGRFAGRDKP